MENPQRYAKKEHIYGDQYYNSIVIANDNVYVQDFATGIYQIKPDGRNVNLIYKGDVNAYFSVRETEDAAQGSYFRFNTKTEELEPFLPNISPNAYWLFSSFLIKEDYFYSIVKEEETYGILTYNLKTKEQEICQELSISLPICLEPTNSQYFYLDECGDYLIFLCVDYATKGKIVSILHIFHSLCQNNIIPL